MRSEAETWRWGDAEKGMKRDRDMDQDSRKMELHLTDSAKITLPAISPAYFQQKSENSTPVAEKFLPIESG
jgi:hypothetical protein